MGDRRQHQRGVGEGRQIDNDDAVAKCVAKAVRHLERQSGFPAPTRTGQGEEADGLVPQGEDQGLHLALPAQETRQGNR